MLVPCGLRTTLREASFHGFLRSLVHDVLDVLQKHRVQLQLCVADRVLAALLHGATYVVDVPVLRLVGTDGVHQIQHRPFLPELPVASGDARRDLGSPLGELRPFLGAFNPLDDFRVRCTSWRQSKSKKGAMRLRIPTDTKRKKGKGGHTFFFNVSHKTVAELGRDHVGQAENGAKSELPADDGCAEKAARVLHPNEGEKVHSLVVRFVEEHVDHPAIPLHRAQALEVPNDGGNHARNRSNSFEVDDAMQDHVRVNFSVVPTSRSIKQKANGLHSVKGETIPERLWDGVGQLEVLDLFRLVVPVRMVEQVLVSARPNAHRVAVHVSVHLPRLELDDAIDGLNEAVKGHRPAALPRVEELANLDDLVLREGRVVLPEQLLELFGLNSDDIGWSVLE